MNRLVIFFGFLGVVATGYAPVVLYANQEGHASEVEVAASPPTLVEPAPGDPATELVAAALPGPQVIPVEAAPKATPIPAKVEAIYSDALPAVYDGEYDVPHWAVVTRGAKLHSDANVSSPTTWLYPVGAKLNVIGYRQGWYEIVDPESARRGFIYANYYLEAMSGPASTQPAPVVAKVETPAAKPATAPTRTALAEPAQGQKLAAGRQWQSSLSRLGPPTGAATVVSQARPSFASNRDGVESLLDKAMRR